MPAREGRFEATGRVTQVAEQWRPPMRKAAYVVAAQRVVDAIEKRGIYP